MNIILVSGKLAKARTITLGAPQILLLAFGAAIIIVAFAALLNVAALRYAPELVTPEASALLAAADRQQQAKSQHYLHEHLNAMAVKLGQMQAQLLRLDTVGERLAKLAGFRPQDLMFGEAPGRGGARSSIPSHDLSLGDFTDQLDRLTRQLDDRGDKLGILESRFRRDSARKKLIPTMLPVEGGWYSSNYGWRIDPFTGQHAFHEGIDFMARYGSPIRAAAGGVVVYSALHPQYGNMIEIDHGNGLVTRYAHASKRLVKVGDVVVRGEKIGEVGKTGRATGTHMHFEVRRGGAPQNPAEFLRLPG